MTDFRDELAARRAANDALAADEFFDKTEGLLVQTLANAVRERVVLGKLPMHRDTDDPDALWYYEDGVWRSGGAKEAEKVIASLLGERLREAHVRNTILALRTAPDLPQLEDGPPHPHVLNFTNGVLQWADLGFNPEHHPAWLSTVQLAVRWDPDAECPVYEAWVRQVLPDEDCVNFLDEVLGYLMMNGNPLHKAIMLQGIGRNGKGTFLRIFQGIIGRANYATVPLQTLAENRFAAAELHMKLANVAGDLDSTHIERTSGFKMVTGQDTVRAERKHGHAFRFTPWSVPIFSANKVPTSADTSQGYLSRWEVVPFPHRLEELPGGINPRLEETIVAHELPGVARRGVAGLRRLMARGRFERPPSVAEAFSRFERAVDQVREWLEERADRSDANAWTSRTDLFRDYEMWATLNGHRSLRAGNFYERLAQAGLRERRVSTGREFGGIRLSASPLVPHLRATSEGGVV